MRSGPGAARTILLFHIISAGPSKEPRTYLPLGAHSAWCVHGVYISSNAARLKQNESDWLCYYDIPTVNHAFDLVRKRAGLRRKCAEIGYVVVESDLLIVPTKWWLLVGEARYPKLCGPMCVFITAVPITKLLARGGGGMEDMCYERLRAEAGVN